MAKDVVWDKIRREYIYGDISLSKLAKKHKLAPATVGRYCAKQHWVADRDEFRKQINDKALTKLSTEVAEERATQEVNHFLSLQTAITKGTDKLLDIINDIEKYTDKNGNIDPYILRCLIGSMKDAHSVLRSAYDIPTKAELANLEIARQRLDLERQKAAAVEDEDKETGIVIIPVREAADE